jgi:F-type H+-transporting ATPase subunit b
MRSYIGKILLAALLTLFVGAVPLVYASSDSHGEPAVDAEATAASHAVEPAVDAEASAAHGQVAADPGAAAAHAGGEGHAQSSTGERLKDLLWRSTNFIALVVLLVYFLGKPVGSALSGRRQEVQAELEDLEAKRDEAEQSYQEFESKLAGMEKEMERVVQQAIAQAQIEKERILAEAEKAAEDIKRQAEAAVYAEMVDARRQLLVEAADAAAVMAEELIVKNLTP